MENVKISESLREFLENSNYKIENFTSSYKDKITSSFYVSRDSINHDSLFYAIRCFYENDDFILKKKNKTFMIFQKQIEKHVILFEIEFKAFSNFNHLNTYGFWENGFRDNGGFFITINLL